MKTKIATKKEAAAAELASLGIKAKKSWTIAKMEEVAAACKLRIKVTCQGIINTAERYKSCYFWTNTGNASSRRRQEFDTTEVFMFGGVEYMIRQRLDISCRNFYFSNTVEKGGKRTNMTAIKTVLKKLS